MQEKENKSNESKPANITNNTNNDAIFMSVINNPLEQI